MRIATVPDNPQPQVGQILYKEYRSEENKGLKYASLVFVDEEIKKGKQWMYTQIAHMEDYGEGMEVYTEFGAGGMPAKYTRIATDEDVEKFITTLLKSRPPSPSDQLEKWIKDIKADSVILPAEKERLEKIVRKLA